MGEPGDLRDGAFVIIPTVPRCDSVLMVKHNYGEKLWSLPGGGVKQSEIVIHAAKRETAEETGITDVEKFWQVGQFTMMKRYGLITLFEAVKWSGDPRPDQKEISECQFFTLDELVAISDQVYPAQLKLVKIYMKYKGHLRPIYGKLTDPPVIELE